MSGSDIRYYSYNKKKMLDLHVDSDNFFCIFMNKNSVLNKHNIHVYKSFEFLMMQLFCCCFYQCYS